MKKPRQILPLLKLMLGFHRYGPLPLLLWFLACGTTLHFSANLWPVSWMNGHNGFDFMEGQFLLGVLLWFFLMLVSTPLPFQVLGGFNSLEFLFTRAVDRAIWLRTERMAVIIISLGPLILNLALSPLGPDLAFEPAAPGSPAAAAQECYLQIFPGSHLTPVDSAGKTEQLVIAHGTEAVAVWLVWLVMVCLFLVAGYFSVVFTAWQRAGWHQSQSKLRPWLGAIMINAPLYSPVCLVVLCAALHINILEASFLLFARHPVLMAGALIALILVVQPLSERNIRKLEFEFF